MSIQQPFWESFQEKDFVKAIKLFQTMSDSEKLAIFAALFQQSQNHQMPHSISVLFREIHDDKNFDDFYQAWLPPENKPHKEVVGGKTYQQFFPVPIRVLNASNINNPKEIVSVGLHWCSDEELGSAMSSDSAISDNAARNENIAKVADKKQAGIYKVIKDDNLGTSF